MMSRIDRLAIEMNEWVTGRRSHMNDFQEVENGPESRQETLVNVVRADAAEVARLSAAIQAEVALDVHYRRHDALASAPVGGEPE